MRKIVVFNMSTLNGFFEGPNRELDWHHVDDEFNEFAVDQLDSTDTLLFGRVTYEMMASFWPTPAAIENDPIVAGMMNSLSKVVFSKTLTKTYWNNTVLIKDNMLEEIKSLQSLLGKDMMLLGSSDLSVFLIDHGMIDEIRIMINPVLLGNGKTLFSGLNRTRTLKLTKTKTFNSGNVLLIYGLK